MLVHRYRDPESGIEIEFEDKLLYDMLANCITSGHLETGGILAGYYDDTFKKAVILNSSTAPSDSKHSRTRFYRGIVGLKEWLREMWEIEKAYYLGEWHFHPFSSSKMSSIDLRQMIEISSDPSMNCPEPILFIIGGDPKSKHTVSISIFFKGKKPIELSEYTVKHI